MSISCSFGVPQEEPKSSNRKQAKAENSQQATALLLMVRVSAGSFYKELPIAIGLSRDTLEIVLGEWLKFPMNRSSYVSHEIKAVPFILPPTKSSKR